MNNSNIENAFTIPTGHKLSSNDQNKSERNTSRIAEIKPPLSLTVSLHDERRTMLKLARVRIPKLFSGYLLNILMRMVIITLN
jgi:hypothetical protein